MSHLMRLLFLPVSLFVCLPVYSFASQSACLSSCLFFCQSVCLFVFLFILLPVSLLVCLPVYSFGQSVCLSVLLSIHLPVSLLVCLPVCSFTSQSTCLSSCLSVFFWLCTNVGFYRQARRKFHFNSSIELPAPALFGFNSHSFSSWHFRKTSFRVIFGPANL
jgi:hypothetical protein